MEALEAVAVLGVAAEVHDDLPFVIGNNRILTSPTIEVVASKILLHTVTPVREYWQPHYDSYPKSDHKKNLWSFFSDRLFPGCICNMLCKTIVFSHRSEIQIFKGGLCKKH